MAKIAFDIDDTLFKIIPDTRGWNLDATLTTANGGKFRQVPDYDLINVLKWFLSNGDEVYVWSAGGIDYAKNFVDKFGLEGVQIIGKMHTDTEGVGTGMPLMDIAFDDRETRLAKVDIKVKREDRT